MGSPSRFAELRSTDRRAFLIGAGAASLVVTKAASAQTSDFFPGFKRQVIKTSGTSIHLVTGGQGPPRGEGMPLPIGDLGMRKAEIQVL